MMAKDLLQKKQRIAHNMSSFNQDHEMCAEGHDILSSIMLEMDNNDIIPSMFSNNFEAEFSKSSNTSVQKKAQSNLIPNQNSMTVPKSRKFGLSRKFPLMEKTQRTLKQIRHNRKMPKPMAHLAGLSNSSPGSNSPSFDTTTVSAKKSIAKRDSRTFKNRASAELTHVEVSTNESKRKRRNSLDDPKDIGISKQKPPPHKKKSFVGESSSLKTAPKKQSVKKQNSKESHSENKCNETVNNNSSDSDDYEKFIRKEKRNLPKKSKIQKVIKKPKKTKTTHKVISKSVSSESDSEVSDDDTIASSRSYCKRNKRKNRNFPDKRLPTPPPEDDESGMDMHDETYRDSSTESEDLPPPSKINLLSSSRSSEQMNIEYDSTSVFDKSLQRNNDIASVVSDKSEVPKKTAVAALGDNNPPDVLHRTRSVTSMMGTSPLNLLPKISSATTSLVDINQQSVIPKTPVSVSYIASNQPSALSSATTSLVDINQQNVILKTPVSVSYIASNQPSALSKTSGITSSVNNPLKKESSDMSLIVDLTESDNEGGDSFTIMPKIVEIISQKENDSEESDVELVDVIVPEELRKSVKLSDMPFGPSSSNNSKNELQIKTEKLDQTLLHGDVKSKDPPKTNELRTSFKHEVAYATGICQTDDKKKESKDMIAKQASLNNKEPQNSNLDSSSLLNKKVKTEPCDDCEIILETSSTSKPIQNLCNAQVCSKIVKVEKDSKTAKQTVASNVSDVTMAAGRHMLTQGQKPHEVISSNLKNLADIHNKNLVPMGEEALTELNPTDIKNLLENIKREFVTYQEIIQTEQSVEATFKLLEKCQAERLMSLRSKITKCLTGTSGDSDSIKTAIDNLLNSSQLNSLRSLKEAPSTCSVNTSDFSLQDLETLTTMKIVPISSISECDIKPNLSQLQSKIKKEPSTSSELNTMSFGERCIVCTKDAAAACQQCAKVFFCSHECGKKYWEDGHKNTCTK